MKCYLLLIAIASVLVVVDSSPFLFNAIMSNLSVPLTSNIADLRHAKSEYLSKSSPSEYHLDDSESRNEASPGIFQKTVTKILQKLQFLAQLASTAGIGADNPVNVTMGTIEINEEDDDEKINNNNSNSTEEVETGRFSLTKVFESAIDLVGKMG